MSADKEDPEGFRPAASGFDIFVRVHDRRSCPLSYLMLMKRLVERPILSDRRSNRRTPSFRLRGLR